MGTIKKKREKKTRVLERSRKEASEEFTRKKIRRLKR